MEDSALISHEESVTEVPSTISDQRIDLDKVKAVCDDLIALSNDIANFFDPTALVDAMDGEEKAERLQQGKDLEDRLVAVHDEFSDVYNQNRYVLDKQFEMLNSHMYEKKGYEFPSVSELKQYFNE